MASAPRSAATPRSATAPSTDPIVSLRGERELVRRAGGLITGAREEFLCAAADPVTFSPGVNAAFAGGRRPPPEPGGPAMRKLYTPRALASRESEERLLGIAESGAQVRISTAPLAHEAIVVDRRVAILAGAPVRGVRTFTVIRSPVAVEGVRALVYAAWETATDLAEFRRRRVAKVMTLLGATSRFQAGLRARELDFGDRDGAGNGAPDKAV
ncbi:DNA-binding response regulator [Streptomyces formicae]